MGELNQININYNPLEHVDVSCLTPCICFSSGSNSVPIEILGYTNVTDETVQETAEEHTKERMQENTKEKIEEKIEEYQKETKEEKIEITKTKKTKRKANPNGVMHFLNHHSLIATDTNKNFLPYQFFSNEPIQHYQGGWKNGKFHTAKGETSVLQTYSLFSGNSGNTKIERKNKNQDDVYKNKQLTVSTGAFHNGTKIHRHVLTYSKEKKEQNNERDGFGANIYKQVKQSLKYKFQKFKKYEIYYNNNN